MINTNSISRPRSRINSDDIELLFTPSHIDSINSSNSLLSINIDNYSTFSNENNCFVCMEEEELNPENTNEDVFRRELPISLFNIDTSVRQCDCNGIIHMRCLKDWLKQSNTCPVCRTPYKSNIIIVESVCNHAIKMYICVFFSIFISVMILYSTNNLNKLHLSI